MESLSCTNMCQESMPIAQYFPCYIDMQIFNNNDAIGTNQGAEEMRLALSVLQLC